MKRLYRSWAFVCAQQWVTVGIFVSLLFTGIVLALLFPEKDFFSRFGSLMVLQAIVLEGLVIRWLYFDISEMRRADARRYDELHYRINSVFEYLGKLDKIQTVTDLSKLESTQKAIEQEKLANQAINLASHAHKYLWSYTDVAFSIAVVGTAIWGFGSLLI